MTDFETMPSYINSARSLSEWQEKQNLKSNAEKEQARIQKELLEELKKQAQPIEAVQQKDPTSEDKSSAKKIFIVHGRDMEVLKEVKSFIIGMGFEPIILYREASKGRTIIEKFEELGSEACFAIALFTPDDKGALKEKGKRCRFQDRVRQNVVFECGYFIGKLGRDKVSALVKGKIEPPSDYTGIAYIPYDEHWQSLLRKEIVTAIGKNGAKSGDEIMLDTRRVEIKGSREKVIRLDVINNLDHGVVIKSAGIININGEKMSWDKHSGKNEVPRALSAHNVTSFYFSLISCAKKVDEKSCCYIELSDGSVLKSKNFTAKDIGWYGKPKAKVSIWGHSPWR